MIVRRGAVVLAHLTRVPRRCLDCDVQLCSVSCVAVRRWKCVAEDGDTVSVAGLAVKDDTIWVADSMGNRVLVRCTSLQPAPSCCHGGARQGASLLRERHVHCAGL